MKHIHHIVPKHSGGTDDPSNLIELTIEEHAKAHLLLWEEKGNMLDYIAWKALSGQIGREEARIEALRHVCSTEEHRVKLKKPKSIEHKKKMIGNKNGFKLGQTPHNKGKSIKDYISNNSRIAWSEKMKGNKNAVGARSEETKQKMRKPRAPLTLERKKQISEQMKKIWRERKK